MRRIFSCLGILVCVSLGGAGSLLAWSPGTGSPTASAGFSVDATKRSEVLSFYNCIYSASESYATDIAWSGSISSGVSGTTSTVFKEDVRRRINFYRALAGVTADIAFDATLSAKDQDAALMFAANLALSHTTSTTWVYYTDTGKDAAAKSNIALGWWSGATQANVYGPPAIDAYMLDNGVSGDATENQRVGHRRWLLYSQQQTMGTGDIPPTTVSLITTTGTTTHENVTANALWIYGPYKPAPLVKAVPWPNAGYFPLRLLPARWSFTYPAADFTNATVSMFQGSTSVPVTIVSNAVPGTIGDNTIVWEPSGLPTSIAADTQYTITVSGVQISGTAKSFNYNVTLFDPAVLGDTVTISGTNAPFTSGGNYTFNAIASADAYELRVAAQSTAAWTEGAEDSPTPQITAATTGTYALRQSVVQRTGSEAFQLTFPSTLDVNDQGFVVDRVVMPSGTSSQLQFYYMRRFITDSTLLNVQVSTDDGTTWNTLWTSTGVTIGDPELWETFSSNPRAEISLASYVGQRIKVRFRMRVTPDSGGAYSFYAYDPVTYIGDEYAYYGFFIDDITVTNAIELVNSTVTPLSGSATSFTLNAATAGAELVAGTAYNLQIRPQVGLRWYGYGAIKTVTAQALMTYADWVAKLYPSVTGGISGDDNHNGLSNGVEFAFGLNPTLTHSSSALPKATVASGTLSATFTQPDGVIGVTYGAQWSTDLVHWTSITDTGTNPVHTFSVSTGTAAKAFFRYQITVQ